MYIGVIYMSFRVYEHAIHVLWQQNEHPLLFRDTIIFGKYENLHQITFSRQNTQIASTFIIYSLCETKSIYLCTYYIHKNLSKYAFYAYSR